MRTSKIIFSTYFSLILTIFVTIFLFFYLSKEDSRNVIFYFNLFYACFLEIIFFGYLLIIRYKQYRFLSAIYPVIGTITIFYIIVSLIIIIAYNILVINVIPHKYYYSTVIVLTTIYFIIFAFAGKLDIFHKKSLDKISNDKESLVSYLTKLQDIEQSYTQICYQKKLNQAQVSNCSSTIQKLVNKIKFSYPSIFKESDFIKEIDSIIDEVRNKISYLEIANEDMIVKTNEDLISFINNKIKLISFYQTKLRK
ncbi:MAG: hypothetical protein K9N09_07600 [Candidatus Cloacimonetes bacterium]|nr:hypothetical protein [Candidatus Cloacimonadota bacterium]MCF8357079.1 hypothetical protein [Melioribacteraceae bacterium]